MFYKNINKVSKIINVLVVPLDWGLGHATRCIPLIKALQVQGCNVIIAGEKATKSLLYHEFQQLTFIDLPGYRVSYAKNKNWFPVKILVQLPSILHTVYQEHQWLKKVVKKFSINAVLADNRLGLYHRSIPTIYITHQLLIKTGSRLTEKIAQKIHFSFIRKYSQCWIPDFEGALNLAGELSHPVKAPSNARYIGGISRFEKNTATSKIYSLLIIISGPEPQRTIFEKALLYLLKDHTGKVLFVRGLPGTQELRMNAGVNDNVVIKNHLSAAELNKAIEASEWVISRSGYTTVMDLVKLGQRAILVPTPGQTEQEYLATHLMEQKFFFSTTQDGFVLKEALKQAAAFNFVVPAFDMELYKEIVDQFVRSL